MRKSVETIVTVVVTFIVTWLLSAVVDYYWSTDGTATIGPPVHSANGILMPILLQNQSRRAKDATILLPSVTQRDTISTSLPLTIERLDAQGGTDSLVRFVIRGIPSSCTLQLSLPVASPEGAARIRMFDAMAERWHVVTSGSFQDRVKAILLSASWQAGICAILYGCLLLYAESRTNKLTRDAESKIDGLRRDLRKHESDEDEAHTRLLDELEASKKEAAAIMNELVERKKEVSALQSAFGRVKSLLILRLSDFRRENEFWRNTMTRMMLNADRDGKQVAKRLLESVTKNLKTFGTRAETEDETIIAIARQLSPQVEREQIPAPKLTPGRRHNNSA